MAAGTATFRVPRTDGRRPAGRRPADAADLGNGEPYAGRVEFVLGRSDGAGVSGLLLRPDGFVE